MSVCCTGSALMDRDLEEQECHALQELPLVHPHLPFFLSLLPPVFFLCSIFNILSTLHTAFHNEWTDLRPSNYSFLTSERECTQKETYQNIDRTLLFCSCQFPVFYKECLYTVLKKIDLVLMLSQHSIN